MDEGRGAILLVDDDDGGRYATARILRREGFEVLEEGTGEGTLRTVSRYRPDLVILDVNLPDLSGFEVCRRLKADPATSRIPVLHLSATYLKPEEVAQGLAAADGYLTQPVEPAVLVATVRALLRIRHQEEELESERRRFQVLAETAATAIFLYQGDRFVYANPACQHLTGFSPQELVGMPYLDLVHPEDRDLVRSRAEARLRGEEVVPGKYTFRILTREGETRWILFTAGRSEFQGAPAIIGTAIDITEKREANERLRRSEETFRLLFRNHPLPMWVYDQETIRFLEVNDAAVEKYGFSREEFLSMTLREIRPPEEIPKLEENLRKTREVLEHSGPWVHRTKEGCLLEVEIHSHLLDFEGRPAVLVVAEDVTERLAAQRALADSERRLRTLLDTSQEGVWAIDAEGRTTFVNRRMAEMLETTEGDMLGTSFLDWMEESARPLASEKLNRRRAGVAEVHEFRLRRRDGGPLDALLSTAPLFGEDGKFEGAVAVVLDLTERKRIEAELHRARTLETIGMIAGGVAHEVRNPLFALQTLVAALERKLGDREDLVEFFGHMKEQVNRLNGLMADLLQLGRPIEKEAFGAVDLGEVVAGALGNLSARYPGIEGKVAVAGEGVRVRGSRENLLQVVENLVSNALSFSPEGVVVRLGAEGGEAVVEVSDRGPGIPEDLLGKLFTPFASRRKGGTGLGLAIVKKVVEAHGGTVAAANNAPPPGATFTVRLPALCG